MCVCTRECMRARVCVCFAKVGAVWTVCKPCVCVCMCSLSGCHLCKCTNLAGAARAQTGNWIMAAAPHARGLFSKTLQVENPIFSLSYPAAAAALLFVQAFPLGWEMALTPVGRSCGRFGEDVFPQLTFSLLPSVLLLTCERSHSR